VTARAIRTISAAALLVLVVAYAWITLRDDGRMMTIPFLPHWLAYHLELHAYGRNFPAFGLLAMFGAATVTGLRAEWKLVSLILCLFAPFLKDFVQIFTLTRHFNLEATAWGTAGSLVGWVAAALLLRRINAK